MTSHEPLVGAWSQEPHRGHPAGRRHRSGKAREMLELPSTAFPPSCGLSLFCGHRPPSCRGVHRGCVGD